MKPSNRPSYHREMGFPTCSGAAAKKVAHGTVLILAASSWQMGGRVRQGKRGLFLPGRGFFDG
jgi:hypothetical protein